MDLVDLKEKKNAIFPCAFSKSFIILLMQKALPSHPLPPRPLRLQTNTLVAKVLWYCHNELYGLCFSAIPQLTAHCPNEHHKSEPMCVCGRNKWRATSQEEKQESLNVPQEFVTTLNYQWKINNLKRMRVPEI